MYGVTPPWYASDALPFNLYAISQEVKEDRLQQLGYALHTVANPGDVCVQDALCQKIVGCALDDLNAYEIKIVERAYRE